jgi:hypothetical protein
MSLSRTFSGSALTLLCAAALFSAGCVTNGAKSDSSSAPSSDGQAKAAAAPKVGPGMNANGEVTDASKVESGFGKKVKEGEWEGEITGKPAPGTKFTRVKIGMSMKQVTDLIGTPTDQGSYVTGKAWIPFYFGADRHRFEMAYKGQGRLVFAGGSIGNFTGGNLIWIIHSASESGYR